MPAEKAEGPEKQAQNKPKAALCLVCELLATAPEHIQTKDHLSQRSAEEEFCGQIVASNAGEKDLDPRSLSGRKQPQRPTGKYDVDAA
jgi:hypothetical protein